MKIAVIGAGFTGLEAARTLIRAGHSITVFERADAPGGLAGGFVANNWDWALENHYHHVFTTDTAFQKLALEIGVPVRYTRPITSTYVNQKISQLDSPFSLLKFSGLQFPDRLRTGVGLALLKFNPYWRMFDTITAKKYITTVMGQASWKTIWEPLFVGKFGLYAETISATWFWARIYTRSPKLGYPEGGFLRFAQKFADYVKSLGCRIHFNSAVTGIALGKSGICLTFSDTKTRIFDRVLCTLPMSVFTKLTPELPADYATDLNSRAGLGAVTLVLALKHQFLPGVYWLNINDRTMPYLAIVEHTNFVDRKHYHGDHLLYIGNYLPSGHKYFSYRAEDLIKEFLPHLKKINPQFTSDWISASWVWKTAFAQPIFPAGSGAKIPPIKTPLSGLYLANIQQVYPWDRGVNFALELGQKAAGIISGDSL